MLYFSNQTFFVLHSMGSGWVFTSSLEESTCIAALLSELGSSSSEVDQPPSKPPGVVTFSSLHLSMLVTLLRTILQVFDQMPKWLVCVWDTFNMGCTNYKFEGVCFDLSKGRCIMVIKLVKYTFTIMLHWFSLKFF